MVPSAAAAPANAMAETLAMSDAFKCFMCPFPCFLPNFDSKLVDYANFMQVNFMTQITTPDLPMPDTAKPAKKRRGALLVLERLREDIMWLAIAPGTALDEVELAAKYEVSRTPVREALLLLEAEGFVQFLPNRSTIVAPMTLSNIPAFLDTLLLLGRGLLRSAALNGSADENTLRGHLATYCSRLGEAEIRPAFEAQLALYRHLAICADNRFLSKYFIEVQDASVRLKQLYFFPNLTEQDRDIARLEMGRVVDAVLQGNAEAADAAFVESVMFEARVVQNSLGPRFGATMDIDHTKVIAE